MLGTRSALGPTERKEKVPHDQRARSPNSTCRGWWVEGTPLLEAAGQLSHGGREGSTTEAREPGVPRTTGRSCSCRGRACGVWRGRRLVMPCGLRHHGELGQGEAGKGEA